ncbi:MAG: signal peptidase I [Spirochaetes bacterium]|nr:signal peptidase I [Spirochaetota bacterium]
MLQFLQLNKKQSEIAEFGVISGQSVVKFFIKRIGLILLFIYSTIFIAAIDPFVNSKLESWVFAIGGIITVFILLRFFNHLIKYVQFGTASIRFEPNKISVRNKDRNIELNTGNIENSGISLLGNLVLNTQDNKISFPFMLMSEKDREKLLSFFSDLSENRSRMINKTYDFFEALLVAFILAMHIREYIIQAYFIPTGSMEDTLLVGDHLLVEKITYGPIIPGMIFMDKEVRLNCFGIRNVQKNDIIIFRPPNEETKDYIKRCIAVAGDTVHLQNGYVYINGEKIDEPYTKGYTTYDGFREERIEGVVPDGMVVAMGDNRENSSDSRAFGYLPVERIKGRAFILYWNTKQLRNLDFSRYGLIR